MIVWIVFCVGFGALVTAALEPEKWLTRLFAGLAAGAMLWAAGMGIAAWWSG